MWRRLVGGLAGGTMMVVGSAFPGVGASTHTSDAPARSGPRTIHLRDHGLDRSYRLYAPATRSKAPRAVIVVLHGGYGTGEIAIRQGRWDAAADRHGFVTVAPEGILRAWNAGSCCGPPMRRNVDDVGFVRAVLDDVARRVTVDRSRVFATGLSNGGMMAYRLGCEASDRFSAIAPVAATLVLDVCAPTEPVSLLHIHGLADRNVPIGGGKPSKSAQRNPPAYPPVAQGVARFVAVDGCATDATVTRSGAVTTFRYPSCTPNTGVTLVTIDGGGHSWPGGQRISKILDPPSSAYDATEAIWAFFAAHPRTT